MQKNVKSAVEQYQCPGCVSGSDTTCYQKADYGVGCGKHTAGTRVLGHPMGLFFLGMPKGFNRTGQLEHNIKIEMYENLAELNKTKNPACVASVKMVNTFYDKFNVPAWKHRNDAGHVLVRGLCPRVNRPFIHVILDDEGFETIPAVEITNADLAEMD